YLEQDYVYGGFDGGFWDGVDNVSGVLTVTTAPPDPEITFANLQFPASASMLIGESVEVYAQVEASGVTLDENGYDGLTVWIGYSSDDTDPANWTNWYAADYNGISGFTNRPEYLGEIGNDIAQAGTYYYASRFQLTGGDYVYGGFDGGFWDGVNNVSGVLTVTEEAVDPVIGWANLQWPPAGLIEPGEEFMVYAQAWIENTTGSGTATESLQSWIGYSTDDTDPANWTNWIEADFNAAVGSNDEFMANLGAELSAEGTYYYAARFQYLDQDYVYGGFSEAGGGFWDGVDYVSGQVVVVNEVVLYPITFTATDATGLYSNIKFKGEMTNWETVPMEQNGENWTLSFDILPGTYEWGLIEDDGNPDGIWLIEGPNLEVSISADGVITGDTTYVITYVGLEEQFTDVKLYPNPTKNRLYLEFDQTGDYEVQLLDTKGRLINRLQTAETRLMLPVQTLESGKYVIRIISENNMITRMFIKQ
ncbi:MAG: T9SS type A sorting domain-containing protein, partial [Bacteroidales bacterium]|nr:T9SS type A sorting domain-containing protein [Bacteroidales bacterium]